MKRPIVVALGLLAALFGALLGYLLTWPVPIAPEPWTAPRYDPAAWQPTGDLAGLERVALPAAHGPEDVEVDARGRVFAGLHDGTLLRWDDLTAPPTVLANTGGRPLGLHWDAQGRLLVADAFAGLLRVDPDSGAIEVLATRCGGLPLVFTDDLETAPDGTIWFSDASVRFPQSDWGLDIIENGPNGRLCAYDPQTGLVTEALDGLYFANGVAVSPGGDFLLIAETSRYRIRKLWISGPRAGEHAVLVDNLPGFPDGISTGTDDTYWIAIASPRNSVLDAAADKPWLRRLIVRLPDAVQPAPERTARAIGIDGEGRVKHDLFDPTGASLHVVTSVQERDGWLYLGSLVDDALARVRRP